jgi:hypothetical protein
VTAAEASRSDIATVGRHSETAGITD